MNKCVERIYNGIIKENPTFVLMLGMCPTLATTTSAIMQPLLARSTSIPTPTNLSTTRFKGANKGLLRPCKTHRPFRPFPHQKYIRFPQNTEQSTGMEYQPLR